MTETLYLIYDGDSYQVHELSTRHVTALGGIAMPPVRHVVQRGPRQQGDTLLDVLLEPRVVTVGILEKQATRGAWWSARRDLLNMLKRFDDLKLRLVIDDTSESFDLPVAYEAGAENLDAFGISDYRAVLRLRAHDPVWRATSTSTLVVGVAALGDAGILPWTFPITLGVSFINANIPLVYGGTWRAYPQIDIRGPITNPTITNNATSETLKIETTIDDGDTVRVDLAAGVKTVENITDDANWMQYLSDDSDLATWHLAADPEADGGINALYFHGLKGGANTAITLRWQNRFIGV